MFDKKRAIMPGVLVILGLILTACPQPEPQVIEKVVKETVVVEVEKPVEVQKIVEVTREIEKIIEVTPTSLPEEEKITLHWNFASEPATLDPARATDAASVALLHNLQVGLTQLASDGQVFPMLATTWEISDDGLEYTFHLRDDAQWVTYNTGTGEIEVIRPVTAHDVVYGVKRTLDPRTGSKQATLLQVIKGASALRQGVEEALGEEARQSLLASVGIEALHDTALKVTLEYPAPHLPTIASMEVMWPVPEEPIGAKGERWVEPGFYWSNGPYVLAEWIHNDHIVLQKNPNWWDADDVQIERIYGLMISDEAMAFAMYEANELDGVRVPLEDMDRLRSDPLRSMELTIAPSGAIYFYGFTTNKPPMDDVLVRRALSAAVDRQGLIDKVTKGGELPANTFAPAMIFGSAAGDPDIAPWALDYELGKEKAKEWLAEAGYPDGEGFPVITLMHNTSEEHARIAQAIAAMWKDVLNIEVTIEDWKWLVYLKTLQKETPLEEMPHVWPLTWRSDYADENNWVHEVFHAEQGINWPRAERSRFEELTEAAQLETDPEQRRALYRQAE